MKTKLSNNQKRLDSFILTPILVGMLIAISTTSPKAAILTPDLQLWLKADSIQGVGNGQGISTGQDSSSYGRNASAYTGAPLFTSNALNGQPAIHFTGTQSFSVPDSPAWQLRNSYSIFVVARRDPGWRSDDWWSGIMMGQDNGSGRQGKWAVSFGGTGTGRDSFGVGGDGVAGGGYAISLPYAQYGLFEVHMDGSNFEGYFGGQPSGSSSNVPTVSLVDLARPLTIGYWETIYDYNPIAKSGFCGDIAEILIYNSAISDWQRQEVGAYLADKYCLSSAYAAPESGSISMLAFGTVVMLGWRRRDLSGTMSLGSR